MIRAFRTRSLVARTLQAFLLFAVASGSRLLAQAPTLTLLSPSSATAGSPAFVLNVTGTNFNPASQVQWNGSARPTTFTSGTQLSAAIPASDVAAAGVAQVTVFNPTTGLTSNPLPFTVVPGPPPPPPPPPPPATLPRLNSSGPGLVTQGGQHVQLTLQGSNFRPGARTVISPLLASVNLSQANQSAPDIVVESTSQLSSSLIIVVISVSSRAAPGLHAVDVVNTDLTNTSSLPATGSGTSKPLNVALANSLAAPLSVQTIAITQPRDGLVMAQGDDFFAQAVLAGTGTGTITGQWLWDGAVSEQFAVSMTGGERVRLQTKRGLPTLWLGLHTLGLRITAPNLLESQPIQVVINPGDWRSMRLLFPAAGAQFASGTPPLLKWLPVAGASLYQVGFSPRPDFNSIEAWHDVKDSEWRVPQTVWDALPEGEFYWTVRVVEMSGETRKPLLMRRLIKNPAGPPAAKPKVNGRGPASPPTDEPQGHSQDPAAQATQPQAQPAGPKGPDAEPEPSPAPSPAQPPPSTAVPPVLQSSQSQISANTQWVSGSAADTNVLAFAQQTSFKNGPWRADINGSAFLNSLLGPEPQHAIGRANDYLFHVGYDQHAWGLNLRFGALAPALYIGSEFITTGSPRQGVEPSLRTRAGTFAFWTNTNDVAPGAGVGATFHQQLMGGSYEAPLPEARALFRVMWLSARDIGTPLAATFTANGAAVVVPNTLAGAARGDGYGGLLQVHLGAQWLWTSEYSWSYNNPGLGIAGSQTLFGRAWRSGLTGSRWKTQFVFNYRDVGPNFSTPANPMLSQFSTPGRRGTDASLARPFPIGTFTVAYQYLQSDVGQSVRPALSLHNLNGAWTKNLTSTTVASLQAHEVRTFTGEAPAGSSTPMPSLETRTDTRDFGVNASVNRSFHKLTLGVTGSRDWFRNRVLNTADVITSSVGVNANCKATSFFQLNSNFSVNWIAADKASVGGTRAISSFIQPMLQWQRAGLSVSPLASVGQTRTLLAGGVFTADTLSSQYGGRVGWQWPGRLKFSTLSAEGAQVKLRNALTGIEQNDVRALLLWTIVWGYHQGVH